jgi:ATP phosphoribosyltransferase regulatory subunit HisZ
MDSYAGPDRRQLDRSGRRTSDLTREQEGIEMRQEITRLKAVVEILADAVQALTAAQHKSPIHRH